MDSRIEQALKAIEGGEPMSVSGNPGIAALRLAAAVEAHRVAMEQSWAADRERATMYAALDAFLVALPAVPDKEMD